MKPAVAVRDLLSHFTQVRKSGSGWVCLCPAHADEQASLSIARGDRQPWVLRCFAGCAPEAIVAAAGLTMQDILEPRTSERPRSRATESAKRISQAYDYRDEGGMLLYQQVRMDPKDFRSRRPDGGKDRWIWSLGTVRRVLYRLPELQGRTTVYVVEGEKDADRLWSLGMPATTNAGGAGKWRPEYVEQLQAATVEQVVVLPDHDEPGRKHGEDIARACHAAGLAVKVVTLPDVPQKGDVSDWLDAGHTKDELAAIEQAAPVYVDSIQVSSIGSELKPESKLPFRTAADVAKTVPEQVAWIVPGFAAAGVVTEVDGKLKASGKTTWIAAMLRAVLTGALFMGLQTKRAKAIWLTEERPQTFAETLKRAHLDAATDIEVLHWHEVKGMPWPVVMAGAIERATQIGASIIIVDTIGQWGGLRGDAENSNGAQLDAAEPLQLAAAAGLSVIASRHERKSGGEVGESGRGGSAFSGAVDIVVAIRRGEGKTKPSVRVLHCLSRFSETPDSLVIDLTENGYVPLGTEGSVAVFEAEAALLDRMPRDEHDARTIEQLRMSEPVISLSTAKKAIGNLCTSGKVRRLGSGKKGDPHRYFLTDEIQVLTPIPIGNQKPESAGGVDGRFL